MPTYEYECTKCGTILEKIHKMSENPKVPCSNCTDKKRYMRRNIVRNAGGFLLKESSLSSLIDNNPSYPSKAFREETQRQKRSEKMHQRMVDNSPRQELVPNVGGEVCSSWVESAKLAKDKGKDPTSHLKMAEVTKAEKNRPKNTTRKSFAAG